MPTYRVQTKAGNSYNLDLADGDDIESAIAEIEASEASSRSAPQAPQSKAPEQPSFWGEVGNVLTSAKDYVADTFKDKPESVMDNYVAPKPATQTKIEDLGAPVTDAYYDKVRKGYASATDAQRAQMVAQPNLAGQVARGLQSKTQAMPDASKLVEKRMAEKFTIGEQATETRRVASEGRTISETAGDLGRDLSMGVMQLFEIPVNIIAPDSDYAETLRGVRRELQDGNSEISKARQALMYEKIASEDGFVDKYVTTLSSLVMDPSLAVSEVVKQLPNLYAITQVAKLGALAGAGAVGLAGRASPTLAIGEAISGGALAARGAQVGATAGGVGSSVVLTAGDAAGNTYEALTNPDITPASTWRDNPDFQRLVAGGMSEQDAIKSVAKDKAQLAGLMAAPLGVLGFMGAEASIVARGLAGRAGTAMTGREFGKVLGKELVTEQIEEGGTQLSSNIMQRQVNPNVKLDEGVAQAMATAAVAAGGITTATNAAPLMRNFTPDDSLSAEMGLSPIVVPTVTRPRGDEDVSANSDTGRLAAGGRRPAGIDLNGSLEGAGLPPLGERGGLGPLPGGVDAGAGPAEPVQPGASQQPATVALPRLADRASDADLLARVQGALTPEQPAAAPQPTTVMMSRGGNGYATQQDATVAMQVGMKREPDMDWKIEPIEGDRFRVAAYARAADPVAAPAVPSAAATMPSTPPPLPASALAGATVAEKPTTGEWETFTPDSGTLGIPRAEMPQIKAEHRGAMVNFLNARGIEHAVEEVQADTLKPTQAEFSTEKVAKARDYTGGDRSILVSSDNHIVDGHHQWLAKKEAGEPIKVIRLDAPIAELLTTVKEFPSATLDASTAPTPATPQAAGTTNAAPTVETTTAAPAPILPPSGKPFSTPKMAEVYAKANKIADFQPVQVDGGWAIQPATPAAPVAPAASAPAGIPMEDNGTMPASWVVKNKETGEVVLETFDQKKVAALNTTKYEAVPIIKHLASMSTPAATPAAPVAPIVQPSGKPFSTEKGAMLYAQQQGIPAPVTVPFKGGFAIAPQETTNAGSDVAAASPAVAGPAGGNASIAQGSASGGVADQREAIGDKSSVLGGTTEVGSVAPARPADLKLALPAPAPVAAKAFRALAKSGRGEVVAAAPSSDAQFAASAIGRILGRTVTFFTPTTKGKSAPPNAFMMPGQDSHVYVADNVDDAPVRLVFHEAVHGLPTAIKRTLVRQLGTTFDQSKRDQFVAEFEYEGESDAVVDEEIAAFITQAVSGREDFLKQFQAKLKNQEFRGAMDVVLANLKTIVKKLTGSPSYGDAFVKKYVTDVQKAIDLVSTAMAGQANAQGEQVSAVPATPVTTPAATPATPAPVAALAPPGAAPTVESQRTAKRQENIAALETMKPKALRAIATSDKRAYMRNAAADILQTRAQATSAKRSESARKVWARNKGINPDRDTMAQAISKMGGVSSESAASRLRLAPEELSTRGRGVLRVFVSGGKTMDEIGAAMADLGYVDIDENGKHDQRDFEDKLAELANGAEILTPQGMMIRAEENARASQEATGAQSAQDYEQVQDDADRAIARIDAFIDSVWDIPPQPNEDLTDEEIDRIFGIAPGSSGVSEVDTSGAPRQSGPGNQAEEFSLEAETPAQARLREQIREKAERDQVIADARADREDKQDRLKREIAARQDASAENFQLGQSAEDGLSGQKPMFSQRDAGSKLPDVIIGNPLGTAKNLDEYAAAKAGDPSAAVAVARALVTPELVLKVRLIAKKATNPIIQPVYAIEAAGKNKIPQAAGILIANTINVEYGLEIVQGSSPQRTALSGLDRVFSRPKFQGKVEAGRDYILIDDAVTQGGTFAALVDHIESNGGRVVGAIALTGKQYSSKLAPSTETLQKLRDAHGDIEDQFRAQTGYGFDALTESEARNLAGHRPASAVRDRILTQPLQGLSEGDRDTTEKSVVDPDSDIQFSRRDPDARTIEVDGVRRPIENSKGQKVGANFKEQAAFWRWFGDSKAVDEQGRPLVAYHGTGASFSFFDQGLAGSSRSAAVTGVPGFYFSPSTDVASDYAFGKDGANVMPSYLSLKNPIEVKYSELIGGTFSRDEIEASGHDGVVVIRGGKPWAHIAFEPTQIKSATGNAGTFDPENSDIRFSNRQAPITITPANARHYQLAPETRTRAVRRNLQDYFLRVKEVQEVVASQGGTVDEQQDVYQAETLSYGRMQEQIRDFKEKVVQPLLEDVQKRGLSLSDLALYAYALHAPERNAAMQKINPALPDGTGSGMTDDEAAEILAAAKAEGYEADLKELHVKLQAITKSTRDLLLREGLITQDEYDAWTGAYQNYVPLRGFVEEETDEVEGRPVRGMSAGGKGFNIRGAESVKALGRTSMAGHVIENIVNDYERAVARAERNEVAKVFLNLVTTNPDANLWEIDTLRTTASFSKKDQVVTYNQLIDKGEDTISVKLAGKEVYIKIKDEILLRAMKQAGKDDTGAATRLLMKSLGWYTAFMRNVLTRYNPAFGAFNAVRDFGFGAASALADLGPKGMALYAKHYATSLGANFRAETGRTDLTKAIDRQYEEFRASGATTGGWHMRDLQEMRKELSNLMVEFGAEPQTAAQKLIATRGLKQAYTGSKKILRMLELVGALSENQGRFAAFRAARELGKSPAEAGRVAKELTTNFNRKGEWGSALNTTYLFFNAGVQGSAKMLGNLKSPKVKALMGGLSGLSMGLALMGAAVGGDDDDGEAFWDKIPQFEKERNLIIMLPPAEGLEGAERIGSKGRYLKIPVQYGLNVFTTFGYTLADLMRHAANPVRGKSPARAAVNTVSSLFGSFNPLGGAVDLSSPVSIGMAVAPSIADVGIQFGANVDGFGRPTSPKRSPFDKNPDSENFGPALAGTWEQRLARWLNDKSGGDEAVAGAIDLAPGTIRNLKKNMTGGTGDFISSVFVNLPTKFMSPEAEITFRDMPVVKGFYGRIDDTIDMGLYYERRAEVLEAAEAAGRRAKMGIEFDYDEKSLGLQSLGNAAKQYTKAMTALKREEMRLVEDEETPKKQREILLKEVKKEQAALARDFNAAYMGMKREVVAGGFR